MDFKVKDLTPTSASCYLYDDRGFQVSFLGMSRCDTTPYWIDEVLMKNYNKNSSTQVAYLHSFGTKVIERHKGYGRALLEHVKEYYKGCIVFLEVGAAGEMTNEQLKAFYESVGFKEILPLDGGYPAHYTMVIDLRY